MDLGVSESQTGRSMLRSELLQFGEKAHPTMWSIRCVGLVCFVLILALADGQELKPSAGEKKVVCYFTNWSYKRIQPFAFTPDLIDPFVCTHIIYAFADIGNNNNLIFLDAEYDFNKRAYANITSLKKRNKNLKVMVGAGGWLAGTTGFAKISSNDTNRQEFAKNAVRFLRGYKFDGLDLNWQHPTFREGGAPEDRERYVLLAQTLREEFDKEAKEKDKPRLLLSIAISHNEKFLPAYDIANFNNYMDFISVICYDYHFSYESAVNHHSPLYSLEEDTDYNYDAKANINYTIHYFMELADPDKLVMGIPAYGRSYKLVNPEDHALGSYADGPGDKGPATQEKGFYAHFEICNFVKNEGWTVVQTKPGFAGPYAYKGNNWVGYDDLDMIRTKAAYAREQGLAGVMFWTIDYDDYLGRCGDGKYPLIRAARDELIPSLASNTPSPATVPPPTPTTSTTAPPLAKSAGASASDQSDMVFPDDTYDDDERLKSSEPKGREKSVPHPTPVQPQPPRGTHYNKPKGCSGGRKLTENPPAGSVPTDPVIPAAPQNEVVPSPNILNDLLRLIDKAGGMTNFCKLITRDKNRMRSTIVHKRGFSTQGGSDEENSIVLEAPNLPPILVVLSNSSVYIKEINVYNSPGRS